MLDGLFVLDKSPGMHLKDLPLFVALSHPAGERVERRGKLHRVGQSALFVRKNNYSSVIINPICPKPFLDVWDL